MVETHGSVRFEERSKRVRFEETRFGRFIAESQVHQENSCGTFAVRYFRYSVIDFPSVRKLLFAIQPINYFDEFMESDGSINNCAV